LPKPRLVADRLTAGATPVPERLTVWGVSAALSLIVRVASREPVAEGVKVTPTEQVALGAMLAPEQPSAVLAKSAALLPPRLTVLIFKAVVPLLVTVTVCAALVVPTGWLPKPRLVADRLTAGATPVPERLTVWGVSAALSLIVRVASREPVAKGVKVTLTEQVPLGATLTLEQLSAAVLAKSAALLPPRLTVLIFNVAVPLLVTVKVRAILVVPTGWLPKPRLVTERLTAGATPVPERLTVWGVSAALFVMLRVASREPVAEDVKVTPTEQVPLGVTLAPEQSSAVLAKSAALLPPRLTVLIFNVAVPLLVTVTVCAILVVPTSWLPKPRLVTDRLTAGTGLLMVTVAEADLLVSAWLVAFTVTVAGLGTVAGAL
jgi:hypothetical protein